jgi:hypothetical protein
MGPGERSVSGGVGGDGGGSRGLSVHRLRVTLLDVEPPVWRELRVPSAVPLSTLHAVVQIAFGWQDIHLHEWRVGGRTFVPSGEERWGEEDLGDESTTLLGELAPVETVLRYDYDFSDGWELVVEVLAVEPYDPRRVPLAVLDGARLAPPEDCGGPVGYEHLLDAYDDDADPEHDEVVAWLGVGFDPEHLDLDALNGRLASLWRP